jgi:hypothetical protein
MTYFEKLPDLIELKRCIVNIRVTSWHPYLCILIRRSTRTELWMAVCGGRNPTMTLDTPGKLDKVGMVSAKEKYRD